ncbi:MAG: acyltransferase [Clostridia bacterium]|nr:acyltransferase [Clostridia bacterium]
MATQKRTIQSLQGWRAIMMAIVVIFHIYGINIIYGGGAEAMPFFFILSGFVLTIAYSGRLNPLTPKEEIGFVKKRLGKIYPLYICVITVFLLYLIVLSLIQHNDLHLKSRIVMYAANALIIQSWVNYDNICAGFGAGTWFVSSLVFCYILFPPVKACLEKAFLRSKKWIPILFCAVLIVIGLYQFLTKRIIVENSFYFTYYFPIYRALEFIAGMLLAELFLHFKASPEGKGTIKYTIMEGLIGVFFIVERIVLPHITLQEKYDWRVSTLEVAVFCALIYIFAQEKGYFSKLLSLKPFLLFADISFEVYLLHQSLNTMLGTLLKAFNFTSFTGIIAIVASVVLAVLWKRCIKALGEKRKEHKVS